jgi:hypothetical protein
LDSAIAESVNAHSELTTTSYQAIQKQKPAKKYPELVHYEHSLTAIALSNVYVSSL